MFASTGLTIKSNIARISLVILRNHLLFKSCTTRFVRTDHTSSIQIVHKLNLWIIGIVLIQPVRVFFTGYLSMGWIPLKESTRKQICEINRTYSSTTLLALFKATMGTSSITNLIIVVEEKSSALK